MCHWGALRMDSTSGETFARMRRSSGPTAARRSGADGVVAVVVAAVVVAVAAIERADGIRVGRRRVQNMMNGVNTNIYAAG